MPYKQRLYPWAIVRLLPRMQRVTVAQFRSRSDADGHLEVLRRLMPYSNFAIVFNPSGAIDSRKVTLSGRQLRQ